VIFDPADSAGALLQGYTLPRVFLRKSLDLLDCEEVEIFRGDKEFARVSKDENWDAWPVIRDAWRWSSASGTRAQNFERTGGRGRSILLGVNMGS
jgi:hypothetical protein